MREVLQNYVDRIPVSGHKPDLADMLDVEANGYLNATYPRIDVSFLAWQKEGLPQFAIFTPEEDIFKIYRGDSRWSGQFHRYCRATCSNKEQWTPVPRVMENHLVGDDLMRRLADRNAESIETVYAGLMAGGVREEVKSIRESQIECGVWITAEVEPKAWTEREVGYEDPLVIISRGDKFWLLGWYDLTAGEDHVLGTMTG